MLGNMISKIRSDKGMTKVELAKKTKINIGHLTHIEKEERNPSHKALKTLCEALDVPIQPLMHTYDRVLTDEQLNYNIEDHIKYDSIPIVNSIIGYAYCKKEIRNASFVMRTLDNSMDPKISDSDFVYIELNAPLSSRDIGLFQYDGKLIIRKFIVRKNDLVLRAENPEFEDIVINKDSTFYILGKVLAKNNKTMSDYVAF